MQVTVRNALFQQWQTLLDNRSKRHRSGLFLVQGVRPITIALEQRWPLESVLRRRGATLSDWARRTVETAGAPVIDVAPELLDELAERDDGSAELLVVARQADDDLARIRPGPDFLGVVFDRPTSPGNLGTLIRSADALGADGVLVSGHAADVYDPRVVRATTGSLFAVPVVRVPSAAATLEWVDSLPVRPTVVGTDEHGDVDVTGADLTGPVLLVVGNETHGMGARWRDACDVTVRIPMAGSASSLNAATAGSLLLYEARRQRGFA